MIRLVTCGGVLCVLMAAPPAGLFAQVNPNGNRFNPAAAAGESAADPRVRRARREEAVAAVGPVARDFVEADGEDAVAALFACTKPVAVKLAEFHASGRLDKLPRPHDLLRVIAQRGMGDDVAVFAVGHARELADQDSFDAYVQNPLEYALGLKQLAAGASEMQVRRLNGQAAAPPPLPTASLPALSITDWQIIAASAAGLLVLVALAAWRRRQRRGL